MSLTSHRGTRSCPPKGRTPQGSVHPLHSRTDPGVPTSVLSQNHRDSVERALEVWEPRANRPLTSADVDEIRDNLTGFFRVLLEWDETDRRQNLDGSGTRTTDEAQPKPLVKAPNQSGQRSVRPRGRQRYPQNASAQALPSPIDPRPVHSQKGKPTQSLNRDRRQP